MSADAHVDTLLKAGCVGDAASGGEVPGVCSGVLEWQEVMSLSRVVRAVSV